MHVAITGLGLVTPLGVGVEACSAALYADRVALAPAPDLVPDGLRVRFVGRVEHPAPETLLVHAARGLKFMSREALLTACASRLAFDDAGLADVVDPERIGLFVGTGYEPRLIADYADPMAASHDGIEPFDAVALQRHGMRAHDPSAMLRSLSNMALAHASIELGVRGVNVAATPSHAAGAQAIREALEVLRDGDTEVALAGGGDAKLSPIEIATYVTLGVLSRAEDRVAACAPLSEEASGTAMGEGAAMLVLEHPAHARARGARILGTIRGAGEASWPTVDHGVPTEPEGFAAAMRRALEDARVEPDAIDVVHVAAGGHREGDAAEAAALASVFAGRLPLPISVKPQSGHLLAASGPWELAATLLLLAAARPLRRALPGTPRTDLPIAAPAGTETAPRIAMINAAGLAGQFVSIVVEVGDAA